MSAALGWALSAAGIAVGYMFYGWQGVLLALSAVVFWLLLQFSRALRAMRQAAARPVGSVPNAVMLQARLQRGMQMQRLLTLTRSLGQAVEGQAETLVWRDESGDAVQVQMHAGRVQAWQLQRADHAAPAVE